MIAKLTITLIALTIGVFGFAQTVNISTGGSFTQCAGNTTDSEVAGGSYAANESFTVTICSDGTGNTITLDFSANPFDIDATDQLFIYDGNSAGAPLIGVYNNSNVAVAISSLANPALSSSSLVAEPRSGKFASALSRASDASG